MPADMLVLRTGPMQLPQYDPAALLDVGFNLHIQRLFLAMMQ